MNEKSWAIPASYLGLVLVVGGVAGEGIFEFLASNADIALRAHDEQILAVAIQKAGTAELSAQSAAGAAGRANGSADVADKKAKHAQETANSVEKTAGAIDQELAMAQYLLSDREIIEPDALKARLTPSLTPSLRARDVPEYPAGMPTA